MAELKLNPIVLNQPVSLEIRDTALAYNQIVANRSPGAADVVLNQAELTLSGGAPVIFPAGQSQVKFAAHAAELLAVYPDVTALQAALTENDDLRQQLGPALAFPARPNTHYALLRCGYDIGAAASGSMALGAGTSVRFSSDAARQGLYAVVREIPDGPGILDILTDVVRSWRVPRQVRTLDNLEPGTWIIAEANGGVNGKVAAICGYDLTWVRRAAAGALKGDIGLPVGAGLEAQLGFTAAGKYAVVLSRGLSGSEQQQIRLQVYKLRVRGWDVGFHAGATVAPNWNFLPPDVTGLVKGILGIHGAQILEGLQQVEQWTNPNSPLFGPLVNLGNETASRIIRNITGIADLNTGFAEAKGRLQNLLALWSGLPRQTAALLWSKLPDPVQTQQIAGFAGRIANLAPTYLDALLQAELSKAGFLSTPAGPFLETIAEPGILAILGNAPALQRVADVAGAVWNILGNGSNQGLLQRLQAEIDQRLDISQIERAVSSGDLTRLDPWMEKRLEAFLDDHAPVTLEKLQKLREQLHKILTLKDSLYAKALDALHRQYNFSLTESYQNATTTTALVDLAFDFNEDAAGAEAALTLALDGQFDQLLAGPENSGFTVNKGVLTHGIRRQSRVMLVLPYYDSAQVHVMDALASMNAVDQADGRMILYNGQFSDLVEVKNQSQSTLSMGLIAARKLGTGVVVHQQPQAAYSYTLPLAAKQLTRTHLKTWLTPELEEYFPNVFGDTAAPKGTLDQWIDDLIGAGQDRFGNALLSLEASLPPEYVLAWLKAPLKKEAQQYKIMSVMLQSKFREFLLRQYFGDVDRYAEVGDRSPAFDLLAFASVPRVTKVAHDPNSQSVLFPPNTGNDLYWDYQDASLRRGMLGHPATIDVLRERLGSARASLAAAGRNDLLGYYADSQTGRIIASAQGSASISFLFLAEARMVESARSAGLSLAQFQTSEFSDPAAARKALANFGAAVTSTFNGNLKTYATGTMLLPLGTFLFAQAARAFDAALATARAHALFSLLVVKSATFPPAGFPRNPPPAASDVVLRASFTS